MKIQLLFFGITTDLLGISSLEMELKQPCSVSEFKEILVERYPQLLNIHSYALAINEEYALNNSMIQENDTVAIIPPVSGG